jgi:hypothetical protein
MPLKTGFYAKPHGLDMGRGKPAIQSQNSVLQKNVSIQQSKKSSGGISIADNAQHKNNTGAVRKHKKGPNARYIAAGHFKGK